MNKDEMIMTLFGIRFRR